MAIFRRRCLSSWKCFEYFSLFIISKSACLHDICVVFFWAGQGWAKTRSGSSYRCIVNELRCRQNPGLLWVIRKRIVKTRQCRISCLSVTIYLLTNFLLIFFLFVWIAGCFKIWRGGKPDASYMHNVCQNSSSSLHSIELNLIFDAGEVMVMMQPLAIIYLLTKNHNCISEWLQLTTCSLVVWKLCMCLPPSSTPVPQPLSRAGSHVNAMWPARRSHPALPSHQVFQGTRWEWKATVGLRCAR